MLKVEENELITRVGPGTPMGNFMREYWVPALLSSEVPTPDSDPLRVLLLGEQLIAFRDTNGNVGLIQNNCPHRGASLFFGRNEEAGLRCVYHGWKFDVEGRCIDMPNEPAESDFKSKVKAVAYRTQERGGIVWAYLGPRSTPPPLPDLEGNMQPDSDKLARATQLPCNWLQVLEGDIDTTHVGFLHYGGLRAEEQVPGSFSEYQLRVKTAHFEVIDTEGGAAYGARRPASEDQVYWRIAQWCFPFYTFTPPGVLGTKKGGSARVPMDDNHVLTFNMTSGRPRPTQQTGSSPFFQQAMQPNTTDWYGRFRPVQQPENDYQLDREAQRSNTGFNGYTGITGVGMQDAAMTTSMGRIYDRSKEHLGTTDAMVIRVRRRLIAAVQAHMKHGVTPPGVDDPDVYRVRSGGVFLPPDADWVDATRELRQAFVEHPELDPALNGPL
ncbi:MAG: Rieske 2Fe-2S domain-containing protein [Chloroflexi bacterium]|nr:Rieske 2Fe-2S domain-containing protein [Chloroflexota bacterium]